jgi:hypothetical protein
MSDERLDAVLDAWRAEKERADRLERRVLELEGIIARVFVAFGSTSFVPTPATEAVIEEVRELVGIHGGGG